MAQALHGRKVKATWGGVRVGTAVAMFTLCGAGALGQENSAQITDAQAIETARKLKDEIVQKLSVKLVTEESEHFMVHSDAPASEIRAVLKDGEAVYKKLDKKVGGLFPIDAETKPWKGKYVVLLFKNRQEYTDYWYKMRGSSGALAGSQGTRFAPGIRGYVANATPGRESDESGDLYFYLSGLLLSGYAKDTRLPAWVEMGFVMYTCDVLAREHQDAERARRRVKTIISQGGQRTFQAIRDTASWPHTDMDGRRLCFSLVDFMMSKNQENFVRFVDSLKSGTSLDDVIRNIFGVDAAQFEKDWLAYIVKKY
ncbi:MAG TPA: hypothetical protein PLU30_12425 [Verrucomicrobiae bacterium]|nr:hypothetical protein [Verrucomicrobiae bacterium]